MKSDHWPPVGAPIRLRVVRDTWLSSVGDEKSGNNGGSSLLKVKGRQEYALIDIDPAPLKGKLITGALLHLRSASPREAPLIRLGVSSIASRWIEGSAFEYHPQIGASCFAQAAYQKSNWAYPCSSLMDVVFGRGNTVWKFANCSPPDQQGWQTCAVDPEVVAARVAGISRGFCLYDEVGSTWSIKSGRFHYRYFLNRYFYSRESGGSAPWLEVWTKGTDETPPDPITAIAVTTMGLPGGEAMLEWKTPFDRGGGKTIGFLGSYTSDGRTEAIPQYLMPMAGGAGQAVRMHLQDLSLKSGQKIAITIRSVDSAGNIGPGYTQQIRVSAGVRLPNLHTAEAPVFGATQPSAQVGGVEVSVVDLLDKINPRTGRIIPQKSRRNRHITHLFCAKKDEIRLYCARNETVFFQLELEGTAKRIRIQSGFDHQREIKTRLYQFGYVNTKGNGAPLPDPLVPLAGPLSIPSSAGKVRVWNQRYHGIVCEIYVPHDEPAGEKTGTIRIEVGKNTLALKIHLTVWNFTLPDKLSFVPEMNAYGTVSPYKGYAYYRLAHENRCCINRLPYGWNGAPSFAPKWDGHRFDWKKWDHYVGPLLDGAAFRNLPRKDEPVDVLYLPFNENWPISLYDNYRPSYWADGAFTKAYQDNLKKAFRAFAAHCAKMDWKNTIFQFYLNGKIYYRKQDPESSAPWIFDEPVDTQDFWALRWYGRLWQRAVQPFKNKVKLWFRCDISYSQFSRNILQGVADIEYIGGADKQKIRMLRDEQTQFGSPYFAEYGTPNRIDASNVQPVVWCLSAWADGARGVLPWQSIGDNKAWTKGEATALFYPHPGGPVASVRLKAFMVGQQLVEYLTLFSQTYHVPRYALAHWIRNFLARNGKMDQPPVPSACGLRNSPIDPLNIWRMRYALGKMLSKKAPPYRRALVNFKSMSYDPEKLPNIGLVHPGPAIDSVRPDCDDFRPE